MELYNGKYCASYDDLAGIMSRDQIMRHAERVCRGGNGRAALYAVDTLPIRFKVEVMRRYPDLQAQAEYKEFADAIITDTAAEAYYAEYKIDGVRGLSYDKQAEYTNNATILAAFHDLLQRCTSMRGKLGKKVNIGGFWEARAKMLPRIADRFPNTLPENARRLREKHDEFYRGGTPNYEVLIAIGERESSALITEALRNAANHTAELFGSRFRAHQIQSDHYAMKAMSPIYGVSGDKVTPARVGNAKAKPIERYFLTLNKTYCQLMPNWSGFGITSNKNLQPNADALNMLRKSFPDEEGCRRQIETIIGMERGKKLDKFVAAWQQLPEDRRLPMSDEQYLLTFGAETGYKNALEGSGLNIRLLGAKRQYDCFDVNFRRYSHIRWNVKYDPNDTSRVLAVSDNGELRFMLEEKYVQPMALADRTEGDAEELARVRAFNSQELEPTVVKAIGAAQEKVELLFHQNPQLDNTLCRHLICDSRGQHKDRRNDKRLAAPIEEAEMAEVEPMITGRKQTTFDLY